MTPGLNIYTSFSNYVQHTDAYTSIQCNLCTHVWVANVIMEFDYKAMLHSVLLTTSSTQTEL